MSIGSTAQSLRIGRPRGWNRNSLAPGSNWVLPMFGLESGMKSGLFWSGWKGLIRCWQKSSGNARQPGRVLKPRGFFVAYVYYVKLAPAHAYLRLLLGSHPRSLEKPEEVSRGGSRQFAQRDPTEAGHFLRGITDQSRLIGFAPVRDGAR